jgi:hypothetical protein
MAAAAGAESVDGCTRRDDGGPHHGVDTMRARRSLRPVHLGVTANQPSVDLRASDRLLIIGGTLAPYKNVQAEQDLRLRKFLRALDSQAETADGADPEDKFWLDIDGPYHPFKKAPIHQHRASQDRVTGMAELILQKEAADLGIDSEIVTLDEMLDSRWQLIDPHA